MAAMKGQNTAGNASTYGVAMNPVSQYTQYANQAPTGLGQTNNPFSINPNNYAQNAYTPTSYGSLASMAQRFQQPQQSFYGQGMQGGMGQMQSPFSSYAQPQQQFQPQQQSYYGQGMQGGMGRTATPFGAAGSTGAFGGGFGGAGLYGKK
jgi:hypothetical protein